SGSSKITQRRLALEPCLLVNEKSSSPSSWDISNRKKRDGLLARSGLARFNLTCGLLQSRAIRAKEMNVAVSVWRDTVNSFPSREGPDGLKVKGERHHERNCGHKDRPVLQRCNQDCFDGCGANFRNRRSEALGNIMRLMRRELHSRFLARFCHLCEAFRV